MAGVERPFGISDAVELISEHDANGRIGIGPPNYRDAYWSWDSGFLAAGLAYVDADRAGEELTNLLSTQHTNGMVPHIVRRHDLPWARLKHHLTWGGNDPNQHRLASSGITQPPVLATAARIVAEQMSSLGDRQDFLSVMYSGLVDYHSWFLRERDPNNDSRVTIIHPWESGMDNAPSMLGSLRPNPSEHLIGRLTNSFRNDVRHGGLDSALRTSSAHGIAMSGLVYNLRLRNYNSGAILRNPRYAVDSVLVNNVLLKATKDLDWMADELGTELPDNLRDYLAAGRDMIDSFWDDKDKRFYDIDARSGEKIAIPAIANILPLINHEELSEEQANCITGLLQDESEFATPFAAPTMSRKSGRFHDEAYWSGPMWPWMNRYLFHAAKEAGEVVIARQLRNAVVETVSQHGAYEHYSPLSGKPGGAANFTPTAATYIEMDSQAA